MLPGAKRVIVHGRRGVFGPIAFVLALLLVVVAIAAGFLWVQEAGKRLQAERELAALEKKYSELKDQCNAMKNGGQAGGISLSGSQNPIITGLEMQTQLPMCEQPTIQPFKETMRAQDKTFFAEAQEGDVLVSYAVSKVIYLYRPSSQQLINQANVPSQPQGAFTP